MPSLMDFRLKFGTAVLINEGLPENGKILTLASRTVNTSIS